MLFSMKVPTRSSKCLNCETPIKGGSRYLSVLVDEERRDYCSDCGPEQTLEGHHWWGEIPVVKKEDVPLNEQLLENLRLLAEKKSPLAYLLAQYLVRQEMLVKRGKTHFEVPKTGETFALKSAVVAEEEATELRDLIAAHATPSR